MAAGTGNLPVDPATMDAVPFAPITSQWGDDVITNISALADGSGIGDGALGTDTLAQSAVTADRTDLPSVVTALMADGLIQSVNSSAIYYPSGSTSQTTITFPIPFASAPYVQATPNMTGFGEIYTVHINTISATQLVLRCRTNFGSNVTGNVRWLAIGIPA